MTKSNEEAFRDELIDALERELVGPGLPPHDYQGNPDQLWKTPDTRTPENSGNWKQETAVSGTNLEKLRKTVGNSRNSGRLLNIVENGNW